MSCTFFNELKLQTESKTKCWPLLTFKPPKYVGTLNVLNLGFMKLPLQGLQLYLTDSHALGSFSSAIQKVKSKADASATLAGTQEKKGAFLRMFHRVPNRAREEKHLREHPSSFKASENWNTSRLVCGYEISSDGPADLWRFVVCRREDPLSTQQSLHLWQMLK